MSAVKFIFGVHNHQPVGNFDFVFRKAFEQSYKPFLSIARRHPSVALTFHFSGPLLEWLEANDPAFLDQLAQMVTAGRIEIMSGGFYEPILPIIPDHDKLGQIRKMNVYIQDRFNYRPEGLWLTERVWEPHLAKPISEAGISYLPVDDYHFLSAGLAASELHGYFLTEEQNATVGAFPISQRLRYAIPFQDPEETIKILRAAGESGEQPVMVMMDDGEKFGLWPGSWEHCFGREKWLERFFTALEDNSDWLETTTFGEVFHRSPPSGRVYLPTASYFEMSKWSLPAESGAQFDRFLQDLQVTDILDRVRAFVQGGTWRNFLAKYPESNWMQKRVFQVSQKIAAKTKGSVELAGLSAAQDDLWRSQCNCAFWHGIFGGLYLPHLRHAIYHHMLKAETAVDAVATGCRIRQADIDRDGWEEIEITTPAIKVFLTPRGGAMRELDILPAHFNLLNTLARYRESYHDKVGSASTEGPESGSIHSRILAKEADLESHLHIDRLPRHSLLDRFYPPAATIKVVGREPALSANGLAAEIYDCTIHNNTVQCSISGEVLGQAAALVKTITFRDDQLGISMEIVNNGTAALKGLYALEFNFALLGGHTADRYYLVDGKRPANSFLDARDELRDVNDLALVSEFEGVRVNLRFPEPTTIWRYPVETVNLSEGGFERVYQSSAVLPVYTLNLAPGQRLRIAMTLQAQVH